ncbi:MAG: sodium:calcium antiporter [Chloroflexota bacterium]|nr:sodium:calcium antiporter [Chloroflexota bacterium]
MLQVWVEFIVCLVLIGVSSRTVARYGDLIADRTGLGGVWVGVALLAVITSLPELFTGLGAITFVKSPDLAIGELFGSCVFNLMIIALLDLSYRNGPLLGQLRVESHLRSATMSMVLIAVAVLGAIVSTMFNIKIGWIGIETLVIIILYAFMFRSILRKESNLSNETDKPVPEDTGVSLTKAYLIFGLGALVVAGAGIWLAFVGEDIADATGLEESFVGTLIIAFTTSFPEVTVSYSALRIGALDMSVANMAGSNMFNILIVGILDILYGEAPILSQASSIHIVTGLMVLLMTSVFIAGIMKPSRRWTRYRLSWYAPLLLFIYLVTMFVNFSIGSS